MRTERPGYPHVNTTVATYLTKRIDELRGIKSQREIAAEAGYAKPNIISMFKSGETAVPLDKIAAIAKAIESDPAHLFRLAMQDRWPEVKAAIDQIFGRGMASANEAAIFLEKWRKATSNLDPAPSAEIEAAIDKMLLELKIEPR